MNFLIHDYPDQFLTPCIKCAINRNQFKSYALSQNENFNFRCLINRKISMKLFLLILIAVAFLVPNKSMAFKRKLKPFVSNGCSVPSAFENSNYDDCCYVHDYRYWVGGTLEDKRNADVKLANCMREKGAANFTADAWEYLFREHGMDAWQSYWEPRRDLTPLTDEERAEVKKMSLLLKSRVPVVTSYAKIECNDGIIKAMKTNTDIAIPITHFKQQLRKI